MAVSNGSFYSEKFMKQLKSLRKMHGYSQNDVAQRLHMERSTYAYYEQGATQPPIETLVRIAALYNVSVDYLLGIEREWAVNDLAIHMHQFLHTYFQEMEKQEIIR